MRVTAPARHQATDDLTGRVRAILADLIDRYERRIDLSREAIVDYAATRVTIDPQVLAGLHAQALVEQLRQRHLPRTWHGGQVTVCRACNVAWPCPDAELLA